jgi:outer membrane protein
MLSDELRKKWEGKLLKKEKEVRDLQRKYFGQEGELFKKNMELIKPIQDGVNSAIQKIAGIKKYTIVLDKSVGITVMFSLPTLDISEDVITELGIK